jgi:hypothetical protein
MMTFARGIQVKYKNCTGVIEFVCDANFTNTITAIEEFYCTRMIDLVDENRIDDSNAIFEEFIVDEEEPVEWLFMNYISDVLN